MFDVKIEVKLLAREHRNEEDATWWARTVASAIEAVLRDPDVAHGLVSPYEVVAVTPEAVIAADGGDDDGN